MGWNAVQVVAFVSQVVLTCSSTILTHASRNDAGKGAFHYNTLTIPFFSELCKVVVSCTMLLHQVLISREEVKLEVTPYKLWTSAVPSFLYFVTNNLNFLIIKALGPTAFQLLNNMKILATAVLFRIVMKAYISPVQWRMLCVLTAGAFVSQLETCGDGGAVFSAPLIGYVLKALNSFLTAFASVYTEKLMKGNGDSIHFQNMILYVWGVVFTTLSLFVNSSYRGTPLTVDMLFENHNVFSVTLIFNYAFTGLATAFVIKFLDNMLKTFAATCAMFLVSLVSSAIYKEPVTMQLLVGMSIVGLAVEVYTREQARITRGKQPPIAAASPAGQLGPWMAARSAQN